MTQTLVVPTPAEVVPAAPDGIGRRAAPAISPETIALAQAGDHAAFEVIFAAYQEPIFNYITRMMGSTDDAYELTQDTFLKAYLNLGPTSADLKIGAWLYRIATNTCLDEIRHRRLVQWQSLGSWLSVFHPSQVAKDSPDRTALDGERHDEVQRVLDRLKPIYRACLILKEYFDYSYDQIAEVLHTTRAAVKSYLYRAREQFRKIVAADPSSPLFLSLAGGD